MRVCSESDIASTEDVRMAGPRALSTTDSVRIGDWQCRYLEDGCRGPGWYTYVIGRPTLSIDDLPIASSWLPMLEAARLGDRNQG